MRISFFAVCHYVSVFSVLMSVRFKTNWLACLLDECAVQQKQGEISSTLNGPAASADKGKRKMSDLSNDAGFSPGSPCCTPMEIDIATLTCNFAFLFFFQLL